MEDTLMKLLIDPLKQRLIMELHRRQRATVNDLSDGCPDIPRSTIYRHMAKFEKEGVVEVVDMVRKRGTMEKTYVLSESLFGKPGEPPTKALVSTMFSQFCLQYLEKCNNYLESYEGDPEKMKCLFSSAPFYATDNEFAIFVNRVGKLITEMTQNPPSEDRKLYSMGIMLMPSEDSEQHQ